MTSKSSLPVSLQPLPLAAYLTGAVGSTFLISAPQAEAAVTSVTFGFGSVLDSSDGINYFPTTPDLGPLFVVGTQDGIAVGHPIAQVIGRAYHSGNHSGNPSPYYGITSFFASGTVIGNGLNGALGIGYFTSNNLGFSIPTDQLNKNIGFQTGEGNWGWANVSWNATAKALTINSAYVESVAGNTITVGDIGAVPEPSRALLALAGLGAAALRRRRKQAA